MTWVRPRRAADLLPLPRVAAAVTFLGFLTITPIRAFASDHVIAVDVSGSMRWNEAGQTIKPGVAGPMRIDIVRPPLLRYLNLLPDDSRVFLVAFNDGVVAQNEFVLSRPADREHMLAWVEGLNPPRNSRTHLWYTLRKALQKAREYAVQAPGEWVSVRVITDGEDDHPGSDLTLTKVLDEFPEIEEGKLRPDLVLLGSLKAEFLVPIEREQERKRVNMIQPKKMEDPLPPVISAAPDPVIAGRKTTIADASKAGFANYTWYLDEERISAEPSFEHTFAAPAQVRLRVEAVRRDGSRDTATRTISVLPVPVDAAFHVPSDLIAGKPVTFISRAKGEIARHTWFVGDSQVCSSEDCEHTFPESGEYAIKLVVADAAGNTDEATQNVSIGAPPPVIGEPVAGFKVAGSGAVKAGEPVQFMDDSHGLVETYRWSFSGTGSSNEKNPVYTFPAAGEQKVELSVVGPGGSSTATQTIEVVPQFIPPVVSITAEPDSGTVPFEVRFQASVEGDYDSLVWEFGDGHTSQEASPVHVYTTAGPYRPVARAKHSVSGLEGVYAGDLTITAKAPMPAWMRQAFLAAALLVVLLASYAVYDRFWPKLGGRLLWEFNGTAGEVVLSGRKYPLSKLEMPGWKSEAGHYLRDVGGTVTIKAKGRGDGPLPLHERVTVDGAVFTYKGFE